MMAMISILQLILIQFIILIEMQKYSLILIILLFASFLGYFATYLRTFSEKPNTGQKRLIQYKNQENEKSLQVVLIIIDAMRYQFIDRMPYLRQMVERYPENAHLNRMICSDPSDTLTNIRTMMTGANLFGYGKIHEMIGQHIIQTDSLFNHIRNAGKQVAVMGDPIWQQNFQIPGNNLVCGKAYDIFDIGECDISIESNIDNIVLEKKENSTDSKYELVIGHFLKLDHNMHIKRVSANKELSSIFEVLDQIFQNKTQVINKQTMLFIVGDHGIDQMGYHSGISKFQKQTILYAFHKTQPYTKISLQESIKLNFTAHQQNEISKFIRMFDITSTLSILLNIPCPANSIGYPLLHVLPKLYHKYFPQIQFNVLQQYKEFIDYYKIENTFQCRDIHKWIADSQANLDKVHEPSFYFQRRQLIIDNLFNNCLIQINLADPSGFSWFFLILAIILTLILWLKVFPNNQRKLSVQFLKDQVTWIFSKCLIATSSYLIFHQLPYLVIIIVMLIMVNNNLNLITKCISLVLIVLIGQCQNYGFQLYYHGIFYSQNLSHLILGSSNLLFISIILWGSYQIYLISSYFIILQHKSRVISIGNDQNYFAFCKRYIQKLGKHAFAAMCCIVLMTILQIILVGYCLLNMFVFSFTNSINFNVRAQYFYYWFAFVLVRIIYEILSLKHKKQMKSKKMQFQQLKFLYSYQLNINMLLITIFSFFLNQSELITVLVLYFLIKNINSKSKIEMFLSFLAAEITWRTLGINYQFSTIKIDKGFAFYSQFNIFTSIPAYILYFSGLHLITLASIYSIARSNQQQQSQKQFINYKQYNKIGCDEVENELISKVTKQYKQMKLQTIIKQKSEESVQNKQIYLPQKPQQIELISKFDKNDFWKQLPKYLLIPVTGFISTQLNLSFRTGTDQSMQYVIIMIIQLIELIILISLSLFGIGQKLMTIVQKLITKLV